MSAGSVAEAIRRMLQQGLNPQHMEVHDDSAAHAGHAGAGGKGHFRIRIVSMRFLGLKTLQRHRMVNELLASLFDTHLHALTMETLTPEEYRLINQRNS